MLPPAIPRPADPLLSIIVPCYNEELALPLLIPRLKAAALAWPCRHEVICVDDGSRDTTWSLLQAQAAADPHWRAFSFSRNFGHQAAIAAGLQNARGDAVVILDADMQDPPEEIIRLIAEWQQGFDVVYGVRESRQDPVVKHILAWGFYRVQSKLTPTPIAKDAGEFALLDRRVVNAVNLLPERSRYLRGLRSWVGFNQKAVLFRRDSRAAGEAKYSFAQSLRLALDGIFAFSTVPLRLATWLGVGVIILVLLSTSLLLIRPAAQLPLVAALPWLGMLFLGGTQLLCLGIVGEYLARIFEESKARPLYIIAEHTSEPPQGIMLKQL
jgi:dolichol-phosphate mannosyltransferase